MEFIDRVEEIKRFRRFLNLREGALACVYGRRRIGKSRLVISRVFVAQDAPSAAVSVDWCDS